MSKRVQAIITNKKAVNHDSYIYSFKWTNQEIQFKIGQHFRIIKTLKTHDHPQGQQLVRKYTPINPCSQKHQIDFLVKIYRPNIHPEFPHGGKYTPFLQSQNIGDQLTIQGPFGRFQYDGKGLVKIDEQQHKINKMFFMAGGSGITPIFQTILQISNDKNDNIQLILLFANKKQEDIVLREELQSMKGRVRIQYILDSPSEGWKGYKGFVTHELLSSICPLNQKDTLYIHCGPFLMNKLIRTIFAQSYPESLIFKF